MGVKNIAFVTSTIHPGTHYRTDGALSHGNIFSHSVPTVACARNPLRETRPVTSSMRHPSMARHVFAVLRRSVHLFRIVAQRAHATPFPAPVGVSARGGMRPWQSSKTL